MKDQPKNPPKTARQDAEEFVQAYEKLCEKYGYQIVVTPAFKSMSDTGTFSVVLQTSVGKLSKE